MGWNDRMDHPEVYGEQYGRYYRAPSTHRNNEEETYDPPICADCGEARCVCPERQEDDPAHR